MENVESLGSSWEYVGNGDNRYKSVSIELEKVDAIDKIKSSLHRETVSLLVIIRGTKKRYCKGRIFEKSSH